MTSTAYEFRPVTMTRTTEAGWYRERIADRGSYWQLMSDDLMDGSPWLTYYFERVGEWPLVKGVSLWHWRPNVWEQAYSLEITAPIEEKAAP